MEINEFKKSTRPARTSSPLDKFFSEIFSLRNDGYTLDQIRVFLEKNGITVSRAGLSQYIKRREKAASAASEMAKDPAPEKPKEETPAKPKGVSLPSKSILGDLESKKKPFSAIPDVAELMKLSDSAIKEKGNKNEQS